MNKEIKKKKAHDIYKSIQIGFFENERLYEYDSLAKRSRNPKNTFVFIQKFLGAFASDQKVFEISKENYEDYIISFDEVRSSKQLVFFL